MLFFLNIPMSELFHSTFDRFHRRCRRLCSTLSLIAALCLILIIFPYLYTRKSTDYFGTSNTYLSRSVGCSHVNQTRIEYGRNYFAQRRVIICGLLRDRESHIPRLRKQLYSITKFFADYAIVIVENDSKDRTRQELIHWANLDQHIHVIGCYNQVNDIRACNLSLPATSIRSVPEASRINKMVQLRNLYLNYTENHSVLKHFDYIIVEDFDLTTYTYLDGFFSTGFYLSNDLTIDAVCSNGILYNRLFRNMVTFKTYFDPYAHKDRQNQDWSKAYNDRWSTYFRQYSCDRGLIAVQSCFSGRSMYRYKSIEGKRYRTYLDRHQQVICEHVGFHESLTKMYLNSEMILYITKNNG